MPKLFYDMYELDGVLIKNGAEIKVPVNNSVSPHYPLPSECDKWIELFENLKNNFTDDEIEAVNNKLWNLANEGKYIDKPNVGEIYAER